MDYKSSSLSLSLSLTDTHIHKHMYMILNREKRSVDLRAFETQSLKVYINLKKVQKLIDPILTNLTLLYRTLFK